VNLHAFVDFDGTVTVEDVGYHFFKRFAQERAENVVMRYRQGEIGAVECLQTECDVYNDYPAPAREVREFISSQKLTEGFLQFEAYCRENSINLTILSAGFDFYIRPILKKYGLEHLEVYSTPTFIKNGRIYPEFIYYDKDICPVCANCKGARIQQLTAPDESSVFIGDGHSDSHGAEKADLVFAKSFLADYLKKQNAAFDSFENFHDVISGLSKFV
jgi:2-hydroxy-3-keto-5-methylthiopentenyl-1-phosphate phosphatase